MTTPSAQPGLAYPSKTDQVVTHLRAVIQRGDVRPGERLVVDRIAADLGVSKVPVREAITRLTGEGLVEWRTHVGPVIPAFTTANVTETALLRVAVESVALELAIPLHDEDSLGHCQELLDAMTDQDEAFPELNVRFHASLVSPIPYRLISDQVEALLRRAQRFSTVNRVPGYRGDAHAEHVAILAAVRAGDIARVLSLNEAHILNAAERLVARLGGES